MSGHTVNRKTYWIVFVVLALLTVLEVGISLIQDMRSFVITGLVLLAFTKAACVLLWYMHLLHETVALKRTVVLPFLAPMLYAVVLISEALYRGNIAI